MEGEMGGKSGRMEKRARADISEPPDLGKLYHHMDGQTSSPL